MRRQPSLNFKVPKMAHGDADRVADRSEAYGLPLVPWQRDFLNRLESASMADQFSEIVADVQRHNEEVRPRKGLAIDIDVLDEPWPA